MSVKHKLDGLSSEDGRGEEGLDKKDKGPVVAVGRSSSPVLGVGVGTAEGRECGSRYTLVGRTETEVLEVSGHGER